MDDDSSRSRTPARVHHRDPPHQNGHGRGIKRSRSPDSEGELNGLDGSHDDDLKPRKRGRSSKPTRPSSTPPNNVSLERSTQTPQPKLDAVFKDSPARATPDRSTVAAPRSKVDLAIRDHTTDQLSPEGDDYIEKEQDPAGQQKVTPLGHLQDDREYRCRTFYVRGRGEKLFMLATECARVLIFRDSYLLFNKNKSLHKIIASQAEKDHLIEQNILPYSYRSRQIAIVTARSMFRQFGAKMIENGKRVKDDYWEQFAIDSGFTEEDPAVEKKVAPPPRPVKETGNDVSSVGATAMNTLNKGSVVYKDLPNGGPAHPPAVTVTENVTRSDYGGVICPRQDITGPAFEDRIQPTSEKEIVDQAAQAAQFNSAAAEGSKARRTFFTDFYMTPRVVPSPKLPPAGSPSKAEAPTPLLPLNYSHQSPQDRRISQPPSQLSRQASITPHQQHNPSQMLDQNRFARPPNPHSHPQNLVHQSPVQNMRPDHTPSAMPQQHRQPHFPFNNPPMGAHQGTPHQTPTPGGPGGMFYPPTSMSSIWPSQGLAGMHSPSPHMNQRLQPNQGQAAYQQSSHLQNQNQGLMQGSPLGYQGQGMGMGNMQQGYPQLPRGLYQGGNNPAQNFMHQLGGGGFGMSNGQQQGMSGMNAGGMGQSWGGGGGGGGGVGGGGGGY